MRFNTVGRISVLLLVLVATARPALAISDAELDQLSRQQAAHVEAKYGVVTDPAIVGPVQRVFARVARAARPTKWPLTVTVIGDPSVNAFSFPNGMVFVNEGLVNMHLSDPELAFVLSHEIAHVTLQHVKKQIERAQVEDTVLGILTGGRGTFAQIGAEILANVLQSGYSRGEETQADMEGLATMARAGYDPHAALAFFQRLQATEGSTGVRLFPSHPLTADRIRNVQRWIAAHPEATARTDAPVLATARPGEPAPPFVATDLRGRPWTLSGLAGHNVLLYFWDPSSPLAVRGLSILAAVTRGVGPNLTVVAVMSAPGAAARAMGMADVQRIRPAVPVMFDDGAALRSYGMVDAMPQAVVVDAAGRARYRAVGLPSRRQLRGVMAMLSRGGGWTAWVGASEQPLDVAMSRQGSAALQIITVPDQDGTRVRVDGRNEGSRGGALRLPAGMHQVRLDLPGIDSTAFSVDLAAGERLTLTVPNDMLLPTAHIATQ